MGILVDPDTGLVARAVGDDRVMLFATGSGFVRGSVTFFHLTSDCSAQRYVANVNGRGLIYLGQVFGGSVVYSRVSDPEGALALAALAQETVELGQDLTGPGACVAFDAPTPMSMGPAVITADPAGSLLPPFRVR